VAFQGLSPEREVKLFVDINSKQRRIDRNLIIDLKADFTWSPDQNYREHTERIIVRIARQLHDNGPLRGRIYFGAARETKGDKITLATFVSVIKQNQLVGGKWHFWQRDPKSQDIGKPLKKIRGFFSTMLSTFSHKPAARKFLLSNMGLRMLFGAIQILERNAKAGRCTISKAVFMNDLKRVLNYDLISDLQKLYSAGGKVEGTKRIIKTLKDRYPNRYKALELDFRRLYARKGKKRRSRKSSK
jgi:hypothetical protein